jgi:DNA-binding MarR family transcriptional regulator
VTTYQISDAIKFLRKNGYDQFNVRQLDIVLALRVDQQTVRGLAELLDTSKPAITRAVDKFEELGWVERKVDPKDRRSIFMSLTKEGRKFVGSFS